MRIFQYSYLLLLIIGTIACNETEQCTNELFIVNTDSIQKIKIEKGDTRDIVISKFQNIFGEEICYKEIEFGLQLSEKAVNCSFRLNCPIKTSRFPTSSELNILINQQKELLLNSETVIDVDSLRHWISNNFELEKIDDLFKKEVKIHWNILTPPEYLELTALEIVEGLNSKFNEVSYERYNVPFCKLSLEQSTFIKEELPVKIVFDVGIPPPPPPPPYN